MRRNLQKRVGLASPAGRSQTLSNPGEASARIGRPGEILPGPAMDLRLGIMIGQARQPVANPGED